MKRYLLFILILFFSITVQAMSSYTASYELYSKTDLGNLKVGNAKFELTVANNAYVFTSNADTDVLWKAIYDYSRNETSIGLIEDNKLIGDYYKIIENQGDSISDNYEINIYPNERYVSLNNAIIGNALTKSNFEKLSDKELILKAIGSGNYTKIEFGGSQALDPNVPSYKKELANREELIEELAEPTVSIPAPPVMVNDLKFYIVDTTDTDDFIRGDDGSIYYPNEIRYINNDQVKQLAIAFGKATTPYSLGKFDSLNNIELFEDFVRYLKLNKVDVILFLPPYNPIAYDLLLESNKYKHILIAEKYLINFAKLNDIDLKGSYNPHKYDFTNEDFFDGVHGRDQVIKKIFEPVL